MENRDAVKWIEVTLRELDGEGTEATFDVLNRWGHGGAVIEHLVRDSQHENPLPLSTTMRAYFPMDGTESQVRAEIEREIWHLSQLYPLPNPGFRVVDHEDWANAWKKHYGVQRIGHRLVVVPSWQKTNVVSGDIVIRVDPGQAFGTGLHPSTRLCLLQLERLVRRPAQVLDVGTGSGILAIAAAKLGAGAVTALDTDSVAVSAAQENAKINSVEHRVHVLQGTIGDVPEQPPWDIIVVNILAEVIVEMMPALVERLSPQGRLILSGIIMERETLVQTSLQQCGLRVVSRDLLRDWVALVAMKSGLMTG
ncbi:MAG: 50S ribosomal protein L11 methyltransferase [Chloroflexi bacterium]|nr:50S ribosomal protein L11 methyltransferase [Chloroflexota bacterium]